MKKYILIYAFAALLISCNGGENTPQQKQSILFNINTFSQTTLPMHAPQAAILDDEEGTALTDLFVFDGQTQLAHQTSDADDFGIIKLELTHGKHNLSFICTRSSGIEFADGIMTFSSVRSTFGKLIELEVSSSTPAQDITLDRISGQMTITINDAFPNNAAEIEFVINPRYTKLNVTSLQAVDGDEWSQKVSCTSKAGQSGVSYTFNHICPSLIAETEAEVTINIYNASGSILYTVNIPKVRLAANTKTLLSGNLFNSQSITINTNTSWNESISQSW